MEGLRVRSIGSVLQTVHPFGGVPSDPAVRRLSRHAQLLGDVRDGTTQGHPLDQQLPALHGETGITVGYETLRISEEVKTSTATGGLRSVNDPYRVSPA
jgi:hypothetical protein